MLRSLLQKQMHISLQFYMQSINQHI